MLELIGISYYFLISFCDHFYISLLPPCASFLLLLLFLLLFLLLGVFYFRRFPFSYTMTVSYTNFLSSITLCISPLTILFLVYPSQMMTKEIVSAVCILSCFSVPPHFIFVCTVFSFFTQIVLPLNLL